MFDDSETCTETALTHANPEIFDTVAKIKSIISLRPDLY
jgi:hypothetical protein